MKVEIKIPSFGESVVEATIGAIFKATGSAVQVDDEILELETDKLNQVLHAPAGGKIEQRRQRPRQERKKKPHQLRRRREKPHRLPFERRPMRRSTR